MPAYIDGFVVPVPKKSLKAYRALARRFAKIWIEHGASSVHECIADDVPYGKLTSFPRSVKQKPNETVIFSYIVYKSRGARDRCMKKVMADKRLDFMMKPGKLPFDAKRMIFGGFKTIVEA